MEVARIGCAQGRAFATEVVVGYLAYRAGGWPALGIYAVLAVVAGAAFTWLGWRINTKKAENARRLERLIERASRESARRYPLPRRSP